MFTIFPDGGHPFEVAAAVEDFARWAALEEGRDVAVFATTLGTSDVVEVAWCAATRVGLYASPLAEFRDRCDVTFAMSG